MPTMEKEKAATGREGEKKKEERTGSAKWPTSDGKHRSREVNRIPLCISNRPFLLLLSCQNFLFDVL